MSIKQIVMWTAPGVDGFIEEYLRDHVPFVRALPGVQRVQVSALRSRGYSLVAEMEFPDIETLKSAFGSTAGSELVAHTRHLEVAYGVSTTAVIALEPFEE